MRELGSKRSPLDKGLGRRLRRVVAALVGIAALAVSGPPLAVSDSPLAVSDSPLAVSDSPLAVSDSPLAVSDSPLPRGDAAWRARAEGRSGDRAAPEPIATSIRAYESAVEQRPDALEPRWKLLRSLHFQGAFAEEEGDARRRSFERATRISEESLDRLAARVGDGVRIDSLDASELGSRVAAPGVSAEDVARLHFWSALCWGSWSSEAGLLGAVREGVADRLRRYAQVALELEPGYEDGGAYRLLGRLHATLPRVPFLSGWVDRDRAVPLVERAYALAPDTPGNQLLLALTLLDLAPERRDEALSLLRRVESLSPRPEQEVEDLTLRQEARERLETLGMGSQPDPERAKRVVSDAPSASPRRSR